MQMPEGTHHTHVVLEYSLHCSICLRVLQLLSALHSDAYHSRVTLACLLCRPGQMQAAFEQVTYALQVGELSGPVVSDSGVHLILRTA